MLGLSWLLACGSGAAPSGGDVAPVDEAFVRGVRVTVPVLGGTLAVGGDRAIMAEPEQGLVWVVDLDRWEVEHFVELGAGDIPFRVVATPDRAFLTLRGADQLASVDLATGEVDRAAVCLEPRGLALHQSELWVACASGEVVVLDQELRVQSRFEVDTDLRDIVFTDDGLWLSRFRTAELLRVDVASREVVQRVQPRIGVDRSVGTAWRLRPHPDGDRVVLLHQGRLADPIGAIDFDPDARPCYFPPPPPDTPPCDVLPVTSHVTIASSTTVVTGAPLLWSYPLVDFRIDDAAIPELHFVSTGPSESAHGALVLREATQLGRCIVPRFPGGGAIGTTTSIGLHHDTPVKFSRHPPALARGASLLELAGSDEDEARTTAMELFQGTRNPNGACASCHPEGEEDGHVWQIEPFGMRRTMPITGGVLDRAPFHWRGEHRTFQIFVDEVFTGRMDGPRLPLADVDALGTWLHGLEPVRFVRVDRGAARRGEAVFDAAGCADCHEGDQLTNNGRFAIQDSERFKVPTLIGVGSRGPYMHDGCAPTLLERFTDARCGGGGHHGDTDGLSVGQRDDLIAFLQTL